MGDGADRVATVTGDEPIENHPDLKIAQSGLLMASDPERGALAERHLGPQRRIPLPFCTLKTLLLDADDVGERGFPFFEVSPDSFAACGRSGTATSHGVLGFATLTTLMLRYF